MSENSLFSSEDDWHFNTDLYRKHFDKRYDDKLCICGHKIQELCHIYFKNIEWSFQVGNCCIKKNLDFLWIKYTDARKALTKEYKSIHDVISSLLKDVVKNSVIYTYCKICDKRYDSILCIPCNPIEYFLHTHKVKQFKKEEEYIALMNFMALDKIRIKQRHIEEQLEIQQRLIEQLENNEREQQRIKEEQHKKELEIIEREQQRIKEEKEHLEREKNRVLKVQKNKESMERKKNECFRCKKKQIEKKLCGSCKTKICIECTKKHYLLWECRKQDFDFCDICKLF